MWPGALSPTSVPYIAEEAIVVQKMYRIAFDMREMQFAYNEAVSCAGDVILTMFLNCKRTGAVQTDVQPLCQTLRKRAQNGGTATYNFTL